MSQPKAHGVPKIQTATIEQKPVPRCQYCGTDPAIFYPITCETPPFRMTAVYCGNPECRAVYGVQVTGTTAPRSSLVIPS